MRMRRKGFFVVEILLIAVVLSAGITISTLGREWTISSDEVATEVVELTTEATAPEMTAAAPTESPRLVDPPREADPTEGTEEETTGQSRSMSLLGIHRTIVGLIYFQFEINPNSTEEDLYRFFVSEFGEISEVRAWGVSPYRQGEWYILTDYSKTTIGVDRKQVVLTTRGVGFQLSAEEGGNFDGGTAKREVVFLP